MTSTVRRFIALVAVGGAALASTYAASVGGLASASMLSFAVPGASGAPSVVGCDNFTGTNGTTLNNRVATVAASCANRTWAVEAGAWTVQSARAAPNATANAVATLNTAQASATIQADLTAITANGRSGGVVLSHDGTSTYLAAVAVNTTTDRIDLKVVKAGTPTTVATANASLAATTTTLRMTRSATAVTVWVNGTAVLNHTLSTANAAALTGGRAGIIGGTSSVRFDDLVVTTP